MCTTNHVLVSLFLRKFRTNTEAGRLITTEKTWKMSWTPPAYVKCMSLISIAVDTLFTRLHLQTWIRTSFKFAKCLKGLNFFSVN